MSYKVITRMFNDGRIKVKKIRLGRLCSDRVYGPFEAKAKNWTTFTHWFKSDDDFNSYFDGLFVGIKSEIELIET